MTILSYLKKLIKATLNEKDMIKPRRAHKKPNTEENVWTDRLYPFEIYIRNTMN